MTEADQHVDALIFDCDGTIADTMPAHFVAWSTTLARHGLDHLFPEDRFYSFGGKPTWKIVAELAAEAGLTVDPHAIAREKEDLFHESIQHIGAIDTVVSIARAYEGIKPMAIATGSERWVAQRVLTHLNVMGLFDCLACADDCTHHKPHPEVFLLAAQWLNVDPGRCVAFEDSDIGLQAARAAGMHAVDVRPMYTRRWITPRTA
jgi:beta-phosphoglucomutase family hydrolase